MNIKGQAEAQEAVTANCTPRMLRLSKLRQYVDGTQYEGRKKWSDQTVPVWEREPCVVWQAPEGVITSNEDLLLGEGRYPSVSSRPDEDDDSEDDEALDAESSQKLDRLIKNIEREAELRAHIREEYRDGQGVSTCVGLFGARNGRLFAEVIKPEFATASFDAEGNVSSLEVKYPYIDIARDEQGQWTAKALLFRRLIDTKRDVTFKPGEARKDGLDPIWVEDAEQTSDHNFGFCPVIYHKFRLVSSIVNETDGKAVHASVLDELDAYNLEASMRHEGALYSRPQICEIGVEPGYNPTGTAAGDPGLVATSTGGPANPVTNPIRERYSTGSPGTPQGRRQGPGYVWQYDSKDVKVEVIENNPGAFEALSGTMGDLRARICETLAWVPLNAEEIKFAASMSGKAQERLMARQINRVAKDRDGFGNGYLIPAYCMLLRIAAKLGAALKTRGLKKTLPILKTFEQQASGWSDPPLSLHWGAWFHTTPEDETNVVTATIQAKDGGLITTRTAVEKVSSVFNIEDIDAYCESLEEERQQRRQETMEDQAGAMAEFHKSAIGDNDGTKPGAGRGKPKAGQKGGSGGTGPAPGNPQKSKAAPTMAR